jgi:hypothetical protein
LEQERRLGMGRLLKVCGVVLLALFVGFGFSTSAVAQWEPGTQYQLKSTDFGNWDPGYWEWNPNFYDSVKLFEDDGTLNMDGGILVAEYFWEGTAVSPQIQPWAFEWDDHGLIIYNPWLAKRTYEDPAKNHTRLSFRAVEATLIPDCAWTYDYVPWSEDPQWNFMCAENRPEDCYQYVICCGDGPNGEDIDCTTGEPVPPECQCENLSIFKIPEGEQVPIAPEDISVQLLADEQVVVMDSADSEFYATSSEQCAVAYRWKPGYWEGTGWSAGQEIRLETNPASETDPASFTPESGVTYTARFEIDSGGGEVYSRDILIGPGNFDVSVPLVSSRIETPFVTPSGKETRKMVTGDNISAFERDNGDLVIQWGEPIVDALFEGGRIELRLIVGVQSVYLFIEAPPQTGTVIVPASAWGELKSRIGDQSASVQILYRAISGESGGGTPEYSRCEVRTYSNPVLVQ